MKKLLIVFSLLISSVFANAFDIDGINLNDTYISVTREISRKGYTYNHDLNCLEGVCQGVKIYLSINYVDVKKSGMLGQLIVYVPTQGNDDEKFANFSELMNIIYHQISKEGDNLTYLVDNDGTQMILGKKDRFIVLTYNTPYYSAPKKK